MKWSDVKPDELKSGDMIRVYKGKFNQIESVVESINGDLYAEGVGWFTDKDSDDAPDWNTHWERINRLNVEPTEPGIYLSLDGYPSTILSLEEDGRWLASNAIVTSGWDYIADRWAPLTRVYTEEEVKALITEVHKAVD